MHLGVICKAGFIVVLRGEMSVRSLGLALILIVELRGSGIAFMHECPVVQLEGEEAWI